MRGFATTTTIRATPQVIWAILTDSTRYPEWNPTVASLEGTIAIGEVVTLRGRSHPTRAFRLTVVALEAPRRMVWRGGMPLGLFSGERTFTVEPLAEGTATFSMRESFSGLLAPLIGRSLPDLQPEFEAFAAALAREAERRASSA